jgi:hypothetical protein
VFLVFLNSRLNHLHGCLRQDWEDGEEDSTDEYSSDLQIGRKIKLTGNTQSQQEKKTEGAVRIRGLE